MSETQNTKTPEILSCGHVATPDGLAAGYAIIPGTGEKICYACVDQLEQLRIENPATSDFVAYLSASGQRVTTWSGGTLLDVTQTGKSRAGFWGSEIFYIQAVAPDGSRWYGKNGGPGMVISMKRAKS